MLILFFFFSVSVPVSNPTIKYSHWLHLISCLSVELIETIVLHQWSFSCSLLHIYGEEHGLSVNADVALWLDCCTFFNNPPLQIVNGFVVVTNELHDEFDNFKKSETEESSSLLPVLEFL